MLSFAKRRLKAALTGLRNVPAKVKSKKKVLAKVCFKLSVFFVAVFLGMVLMEPMNFQVREGDLSYQLARGSRDGGHVQIPLGPAGWINYRTHAVPVNLKLNLVLRRDLTTGQDLPQTVQKGFKNFKLDAVKAFYIFLAFRVLLIVGIGFAAGISISNGGEKWIRRALRNAAIGAFCLFAIASVLTVISYATLDRKPDAEYIGLSQDMRSAYRSIMTVSQNYALDKNLLQNMVEGASVVAGQITGPTNKPGTNILFASDFQGNSAGMSVANGIVHSYAGKISAIVLAGDITLTGSQFDTYLFRNSLHNIGDIPVYFIGGNHEDASSMNALQVLGFKSLDGQIANVNGLTMIGQSDPDAFDASFVPTETELQNSSDTLVNTWQSIPKPPNIVVVHEITQSEATVKSAKDSEQSLVVVNGHTHKVGHSTDGSVNLIDCGTSGADGFSVINDNPHTAYTFQILEFSSGLNPRLTGIWTLEYYGLNRDSEKDMHYYPIN